MFAERIYTEHDGKMGSSKNVSKNQLKRWQKPGDITNVPKPIYWNNVNEWTSSRWLEDGSFVRLKTVSLGYTFPKSILDRINVENLKVYVKGTNLWTKTDASGLDPEVNSHGFSYNVYPNSKSFVVGVNFTL